MLLILPAGGPPSLSQPGKINYFQHSFWTDSTVSDTCSKPTLSGKEVEWWATCLTCRGEGGGEDSGFSTYHPSPLKNFLWITWNAFLKPGMKSPFLLFLLHQHFLQPANDSILKRHGHTQYIANSKDQALFCDHLLFNLNEGFHNIFFWTLSNWRKHENKSF